MTPIRLRTLAGIGALWIAVAILASSIGDTAGAYQDRSHARSGPVTAVAEPAMRAGLSVNSRMVDTGLGLASSGDVYVWGYVGEGGTIAGRSMSSATTYPPQKVPIPERIVQVSGQIYNVNALAESGTVYGWGAFSDRDGTSASKPGNTPRQVRIGGAWNSGKPLLDGILAISTSEYAGAGIREDGTVWMWGVRSYGGASGSGAEKLSGLPDPSVASHRPVYLKGAYNGIFVVLANGDTYYWGSNINASTPGDVDDSPGRATRVTSLDSWSKSRVSAGSPYVVAVDGGINMGAAILSDGRVLSWSHDGSSSRIGARSTGSVSASRPGLVPSLSGVESMQFGFTGVLFGKSNGSLWGYGAGDDFGGLGTTPAKVADDVRQYSSGQGFYLWQAKDGRYWGRGYNPRGAIGVPVGMSIPVRAVSYDLTMLDW